ncbi:MAG: hypothetical protein O3A46_05050 [Candidatus Poribacteria bacterium]|nr:hypothetical protein [Candidatus Poribacteria bacterium]
MLDPNWAKFVFLAGLWTLTTMTMSFGIGWAMGMWQTKIGMLQRGKEELETSGKSELTELRRDILKLQEQIADIALSIDERERLAHQDRPSLDVPTRERHDR